ncbi:MAG TPA: flagellar basal body L-ring protein FlgH [Bdellovibrionales bacterium]|nr:flagellar basal body L-ring protein FlgH [Bdellovibrionales bacterium]
MFHRPVLLMTVAIALSGCGSFGKKLKAFMAGDDAPAAAPAERNQATRFSNTPNMPVAQKNRLYKRTTRESFERDGMLEQDSGSLWVMEGQGSYLFSQNIIRVVGDLVNVELDGGPRSQLAAKVDVIQKLIERTRKEAARRELAAAAAAQQNTQQEKKPGEIKTAEINPVNSGNPNEPKPDGEKEEGEGANGFDVSIVPARIVEKSADGSYRIKGVQPFMIGRKEYKVIVTGMVRSSDINDDTIQASRVLDPRFDIVSTKKSEVR